MINDPDDLQILETVSYQSHAASNGGRSSRCQGPRNGTSSRQVFGVSTVNTQGIFTGYKKVSV